MRFATEKSPSLHRERAELDAEEHAHVVGMALEVVRQSGGARSSSDTAQPEHGHTLHVGTQPEEIHEPCIQRWCGDSGDGGGEDDVDVGRLQAYLSQRLAHCLGAQLGADADEGVVGPSKGEVRIVLHREGQVAPSDGHSSVQPSQSVDVVMGLRPLLNKRRDQCVLVVVVVG